MYSDVNSFLLWTIAVNFAYELFQSKCGRLDLILLKTKKSSFYDREMSFEAWRTMSTKPKRQECQEKNMVQALRNVREKKDRMTINVENLQRP